MLALPKVSIALCTYNGERFLEAQLHSIASQTHLPDELVICDDISTDYTLSIVEKFTKTAPFEVKVIVNEKRLGVTKNFEKALTLCAGDLLFLSDQDDIWESDKVATFVKYFALKPSVNVFFSDALLVDQNAQSLHKTFWEVVRLTPKQQKKWHRGQSICLMLMGNRVAGCMMALRKEFLEKVLPFPTDIPEFLHDTWIAFVASVMGQIEAIPLPLVQYRQHEGQQVGAKSKNLPLLTWQERLARPHAEKLRPLQKKQQELSILYEYLEGVIPKDNQNMKVVAQKLEFLTTRATLPDNHWKRILPVLGQCFKGNYARFADQDATTLTVLTTILGDLIE